jgi:uncharacterized protein (TIGR03067 family)
MHRLALAVAVLVSASVVLGQDDATKTDLKRFQGTWKIISIMQGGVEEARGKGEGPTAVISGNEIAFALEKKAFLKVTFRLDATKRPRAIDLGLTEEKGFPNKGIYELKGGTLTLCWGGDGQARPTKLASTKKGDERLLVLRRIKK